MTDSEDRGELVKGCMGITSARDLLEDTTVELQAVASGYTELNIRSVLTIIFDSRSPTVVSYSRGFMTEFMGRIKVEKNG